MRQAAQPRQQVARGMFLRIADDSNLHAQSSRGIALRHCLDRIVGAFGVYIGSQSRKQSAITSGSSNTVT